MTDSPKRTHTITRLFSQCPHCDEADRDITRFVEQTSVLRLDPHECQHCAQFYSGTIDRSGSEPVFTFEACEGNVLPTWDLLSLDLADGKTMYFVVAGNVYQSKPGQPITPEQHRLKEFVYESKMCPSDWLDPEVLICDGDDDPHGVIKYVRSVERTSPHLLTEGDMTDYEGQPVQYVRDLFPHLFSPQRDGVVYYGSKSSPDSVDAQIAFNSVKDLTPGSGIQFWNHDMQDVGQQVEHAIFGNWVYLDTFRLRGTFTMPSSHMTWGNNLLFNSDLNPY